MQPSHGLNEEKSKKRLKGSQKSVGSHQVLVVLLLLLCLLQGCHARACESQKRVVIRMSRREQDGIEAEAWSIDRDDEKHKEMK